MDTKILFKYLSIGGRIMMIGFIIFFFEIIFLGNILTDDTPLGLIIVLGGVFVIWIGMVLADRKKKEKL